MSATADAELDRHGLLAPLALSVLVHGLLLLFMLRGATAPPAPSAPLDVEILSPEQAERFARVEPKPAPPPPPAVAEAPAVEQPPLPKSQIVAPPDSPEAEPPPDTRFLSEKNSRTDKQTVKKGEPAPAAKPPEQLAKTETKTEPAKPRPLPKVEPRTAAPEAKRGRRGEGGEAAKRVDPAQKSAPLPGLGDLFVRPSELVKDPTFSKGSDGDRDADGEERNYASLGRPELWADPGERGTPDFLPDVREGSFTLLNTKADRFAPFVRRVGLRVFQTFSMELRQQIFTGTVPQGKENVEVEAVMSRDGRRLDVYLRNRLGNLATDRVLLGSLREQIFFDENPPPKAVADDGKIHFVFALQTSIWYSRDENGRLSPGAQWVFGAGLL